MYLHLTEIIFYLFVYAFLGWLFETFLSSISTGHFENRGIFNGPICMNYGVSITLCILFVNRLGSSNAFIWQLIGCMMIANTVDYISIFLCRKALNIETIPFEYNRYALGSAKGLFYSALIGLGTVFIIEFLHPFVFILAHMIPRFVLNIIVLVILGLFVLDGISTAVVFRLIQRENRMIQNVTNQLKKTKDSLGHRIYIKIRSHIYKQFPELSQEEGKEGTGFVVPQECVFAKGLSFHKMVWIFVICAFLGDIIETVFVWATTGELMSRSSVLYGTFSVVWGLGAVVLTLMLDPIAKREDRFLFLGGFLLGGTYEYLCSVFTEIVFGTVFWDYSHMPLNIGGRTNVLFMFFWGIISVVWMKLLYPKLSDFVEKIPPVAGTIITWGVIAFFVADGLISAMAMIRYTQRHAEAEANLPAPDHAIVEFLDEHYPDSLVEFTWPNMRLSGSSDRIGFEESE